MVSWRLVHKFELMTLGAALMLPAMLMMGGCSKKTPEEMLLEANQRYGEEDIFEAQLIYEELIEKYPETEAALAARQSLAGLYDRDRQFTREREQLDYLITQSGGPSSRGGWPYFAQKISTYMREETPQKALAEAEASSPTFRQAPQQGKFVFGMMLADLLVANERVDDAKQVLRQAIEDVATEPAGATAAPQDEVRPEDELQAYERLANLEMREGPLEAAVGIYGEFLARHADSAARADAHMQIGMLYGREGRKEEAQASVDQARQVMREQFEKAVGDDENSQLLLRQADHLNFQEQYAEAEALLKQILDDYQLSGSRIGARAMQAELVRRQGDPATAIKLLEEIASDNPNTPEAQFALQQAQRIRAGETAPTMASVAAEASAATTGTTATADRATTAPVPAADDATTATAGEDAGTTATSGAGL